MYKAGVDGNRTFVENTGKTACSEKGAAKSDAFSGSFASDDPDLFSIVEAWETLSKSSRRAILDIVAAG